MEDYNNQCTRSINDSFGMIFGLISFPKLLSKWYPKEYLKQEKDENNI